MTNTARDFIIGVLTMTLVLVVTFFVAGKIAQQNKQTAYARFMHETCNAKQSEAKHRKKQQPRETHGTSGRTWLGRVVVGVVG